MTLENDKIEAVDPSGHTKSKDDDEETTLEDEDEDEEENSENDEDDDEEDFQSEELNLPETEDDEEESIPDYPVIMDDSEEDRIFKRQLSYPPVPMYHPPRADTNQKQPSRGRNNPRDKIGMLTPMEEVTEPPSSAASIDGDRTSRSRSIGRRAGSRNQNNHPSHLSSSNAFPQPPISAMEQKSILKSRESLQEAQCRRVQFDEGRGDCCDQRSCSPAESVASNMSEYSSMTEPGSRARPSHFLSQDAKNEIHDKTIMEEAEETEDPSEDDDNLNNNQNQRSPLTSPKGRSNNANGNQGGTRNSVDLDMMSDMEQKEKVLQWQIENAKQGNGEGEVNPTLDTEFPSIVNSIIAELHNLDELVGSQHLVSSGMEFNASKQDHLANVSTQLATYLAQVSPQTIITNLPQVIPLVTSLLYLTGSNFRSQLASLTAVNVFIERLRDCKTHSGLKVLPNADLTWLVRALCEISSESSRSVLKNEGVLALARLIKTAGPEMVFNPILFILTGNDEKIKLKKRDDDDDRIVIPTGGPGGAPKLKATALDSLTFALLTFPRDDFNLDLVAKLACQCLLHPKRRMRQASLECLSVISHAMGSHVALPIFRQVIMAKQEEIQRETAAKENIESVSSDASGTVSSDPEAENTPPKTQVIPSRIPIPKSRIPEKPDITKMLSPKKIKPDGNPIAAVSARISRHLLPTPSLNDLVEYAVKIPASSKLLSRQNLAVSRQDKNGSGEESGESGGSANANGRRVPSSGATSTSSVTNVEIELEPVLNALGSGRGTKSKINEVAGSVMAADVAWILGGTGPIKACDGTSVLAPIYKIPEKKLISDTNFTTTHIRQMGMVSNSDLESDSNGDNAFPSEYSSMRRGNRQQNSANPNFAPGHSAPAESNMERYRHSYYANANGSMGPGRGIGMSASAATMENNNSGRMSSNGSYSLLPNKYSLVANGMNGMGGRGGVERSSLHSVGGVGGALGDPMSMSPHHIPGTYDYSYGSNGLDGMDGYGSSALGAPDPYADPPTLRAPSRAKMMPLQPVHSLRPKYYDSQRAKVGYSDDEDVGINNASESSASCSEDEDEIVAKQEALLKAERRASQISSKSSQGSLKGGKNGKKGGKKGKTPKNSPKKMQNNGKGSDESDKVGQIVRSLQQQEYQVYRVDRVELDPGAPSPEELAASKKKRGELDSAGSNSRDSGVSIGAGSVASVHTPPGDKQQSEDQPTPSQSVDQDGQDDGENSQAPEENNSTSSNGSSGNNAAARNSGGKKENLERSSKRKSALKSSKKNNVSAHPKTVHHAIDLDDGLSRNWKSTPDVASLMDEYEPRMPSYRRMSTEHSALGGGGVLGHDVVGTSPYHSASTLNLNGSTDNYMMLHRKPVLAGGRRQSLTSRPTEEIENRQLQEIQAEQGRSSRLEYHQPLHNFHHPTHPQFQAGYGGSMQSISSAGLGQLGTLQHHHHQHNNHLNEPVEHFHRVSSMLDMDKASPSRESSAGSGNTYSLLHHESALHNLHPSSLSSHMKSSKSTGNLLGMNGDPYGPRAGNPYYDIMDHPASPGRRMLHSRLANHHALDLGNSTDDMEFPMTPQSESSSNTLPKQSRNLITGRMNSKIVPKKIYKGSFREVNARSKAEKMGAINAELFPLDLKPMSSPKHALPAALLQVQASDWETNVDGFRQLVRLARHHPEFLRSDLHNVNMNALRHVMNLRSQVCRAAILFFRELFMNLGKAMEHDSERIAEKLLDKASDTNKFIREDSGKALEALVLNVSPAKALNCLDLYGTRHRNPAVRGMTARMTTKLIEKLGADRSLSEVPERLLPMLCRFLQEGSLDTRMSAKLAFSLLMESPSFDTQLKRHVPADTLRHVQKQMKAITTKS